MEILQLPTAQTKFFLHRLPYNWLNLHNNSDDLQVKVKVTLRPTVGRPVCLGIKHPSGAYDQIFICQTIAGLLMWGALSEERTICRLQLLLALASAVVLGSQSRGIRDHILLSQIRDSPNLEGQVSPRNRHWLPFSSPPTTRRATVEVFEPASTRGSDELRNPSRL
jgi:hypothetical protein